MCSVRLSERESEISEGVDFLRVRTHLGIGEHARAGDKREAREGEGGGGVMGTSMEPASPKSDRERLGTRQRLS